jgi:hypothetical protein
MALALPVARAWRINGRGTSIDVNSGWKQAWLIFLIDFTLDEVLTALFEHLAQEVVRSIAVEKDA